MREESRVLGKEKLPVVGENHLLGEQQLLLVLPLLGQSQPLRVGNIVPVTLVVGLVTKLSSNRAAHESIQGIRDHVVLL